MSAAPLPFTLFVRDVLGVTLEPAQRVFWAVAGGEAQPADLKGDDRDLAHEIFGPVDHVPAAARAVVALVKGADVGASYVGGLRLLYRAITAERGDAAAGEVRPSLVVAPDIRTARIPVRSARAAAEQVPAIASMIESSGADSVIFARQGGWFSGVEALPGSIGGRATRGRRWLEAQLDEASFMKDEATGQVNDVHVFQSVVSRCIGSIWLTSTPWLETSLIWKLYEEAFGDPTTVLGARLPTLLVRTSRRSIDMVERERARDPESAAREFDCVPLTSSASAFFDSASIDAAFDDSLEPVTEAA